MSNQDEVFKANEIRVEGEQVIRAANDEVEAHIRVDAPGIRVEGEQYLPRLNDGDDEVEAHRFTTMVKDATDQGATRGHRLTLKNDGEA